MDVSHLVLLLIGLAVGTFGTIVGAGGGFILMPIFLMMFPERSPQELTATSLAIVCMNAISGTVVYAKKGRIDVRAAMFFTFAAIPGAVLGALITAYLNHQIFDPLFAGALTLLSIYLLLNPLKAHHHANNEWKPNDYNLLLGIIISLVVGFVSSILGIGGGIIHVPAMIHLLGFPVLVATATSHAILAFMTLVTTIVHYSEGNLNSGSNEIIFVGIGVVIGAQLGARIAHRFKARWIVQALALTLFIVALRLLYATYSQTSH